MDVNGYNAKPEINSKFQCKMLFCNAYLKKLAAFDYIAFSKISL
jgi:hypothetical protein